MSAYQIKKRSFCDWHIATLLIEFTIVERDRVGIYESLQDDMLNLDIFLIH